jgi:outer membrane immunogenic protein
MKKALFSATAIALALTAGSTFAADLPSRKEAPIYVPPPPPPMWTGFYVGLNAGGAWRAVQVFFCKFREGDFSVVVITLSG